MFQTIVSGCELDIIRFDGPTCRSEIEVQFFLFRLIAAVGVLLIFISSSVYYHERIGILLCLWESINCNLLSDLELYNLEQAKISAAALEVPATIYVNRMGDPTEKSLCDVSSLFGIAISQNKWASHLRRQNPI